jgi:hypothetical protein
MTDCRLTEAERAAFREWLDRSEPSPRGREHVMPGGAICAYLAHVVCNKCGNVLLKPWRDFEPQRIELVRVEGGWVAVTTPCTCDVCQPKASGT